MPRKPKRPCSHPGCPRLTEGRFCDEHQAEDNHHYNKYRRDPRSRARYGNLWRKVRDIFVEKHPFCEECLKQGKYTPTEEVHHIKPLADGGTNAEENLMALCKSCHSRITCEMGDRFRKGYAKRKAENNIS